MKNRLFEQPCTETSCYPLQAVQGLSYSRHGSLPLRNCLRNSLAPKRKTALQCGSSKLLCTLLVEAIFVELITTAPLSWFSLSVESGSAAASLPCRSLPRIKNTSCRQKVFFIGGGEESRTPVRKPIRSSFYTLSRSIEIPSCRSDRQDRHLVAL